MDTLQNWRKTHIETPPNYVTVEAIDQYGNTTFCFLDSDHNWFDTLVQIELDPEHSPILWKPNAEIPYSLLKQTLTEL